jgi:hypothetical protein
MIRVYIWMPRQGSWGHAAMYVHNEATGEQRYISFWPRVIACAGENPISGCAPGANSWQRDCELEGREPDHEFLFNLGGREDLNEAGILAGWARIKREQPLYAALRNNCCDVIAGLIRNDGGGARFQTEFFAPLIPWTPGRLYDLLRNIMLRGRGGMALQPVGPPPGVGP